MLVCNVSQRPPSRTITADLAELAAALDASTTGQLVLATLVDDPANVLDTVDAYLGEIMLEAASASDTLDAGLYYSGLLDETATAIDAPDGTVTVVFTATTWDPATVTSVTLSGGDLVATNTGTTSANQGAKAPASAGKSSGKYYFEVALNLTDGLANNRAVGVATQATAYNTLSAIGNNAATGAMYWFCVSSNNVLSNGTSPSVSVSPAPGSGGRIGVAIDLDNGKAWFRSNGGNWNGSSSNNPTTNTGGVTIPAGTVVPFCTFGGIGGVSGNILTANFGASSFVDAVPSGFTSGWPA